MSHPQGAAQVGSTEHPQAGASTPQAGSQQELFLHLNRPASSPPRFLLLHPHAGSHPQAGSTEQPHAGASQPQAGSAEQPQGSIPLGASQPHAGSAEQPQSAGIAEQPHAGASQPQAGSAVHPQGSIPQGASQPQAGSASQQGAAAQPVSQQDELPQRPISFWSKSIPCVWQQAVVPSTRVNVNSVRIIGTTSP
ncbi:MAG: hypothetical protein AAFV88_19625 [Planctomycetota bacterium]